MAQVEAAMARPSPHGRNFSFWRDPWSPVFALPFAIAVLLAAGLVTSTCGGDTPSAPPPSTPAPSPPPPPQPNRPPVVATPVFPVSLVRDQPRTFDAAPYFSDPDGDALTYSVTSNDPLTVGVSVTGRQVTLTPLRDGTVTVTLTARDRGGLSASQTFTVTVGDGNRPPMAVGSIPDQRLTPGGSPVTLDLSASFADPDGDQLAFAASDDSGVVRVVISGVELALIPVGVGTATVTVTATDPGALSATQTFRVTVGTANGEPAAIGVIPDQTLSLDGGPVTVSFAANFSDPDGDSLTFRGVSGNSEVVSVLVSGFELTLIPAGVGGTTVTVTATDPGGLSAVQRFDVTVSESARPLETPPGLHVSDAGADFIEWSWDAVEDATGYEVQFSLNESFTADDEIVPVDGTSYLAAGLESGTSGYLRVRAFGGSLQNPIRSEWTVHVTGMTTGAVGGVDDHGNTEETATRVRVPSTASGELEAAGDVDYFSFVLESSGTLTVYTTGTTDTVGVLTGPDGLRETNDDSGDAGNFKIVVAAANPGTYHVAVRGYGGTSLGAYELHTSGSPSGGSGTTPTSFYDPTACVLLLETKSEFRERYPLDPDPFFTFGAQFDYGCGPVPSGFIYEGLEPRIGIYVTAAFYDSRGKVGDFEQTLLIHPRYDNRTRWLCGNPTGAPALCATGYSSSDFVGDVTLKYVWRACYSPDDSERCQYLRLPD